MKVARIAEMRELDRIAIRQFGIRDELLMENAGHAAYLVLSNEFSVEGRKFIVLCGTGNNGGDGFVVARKIHSNGGEVKVFILGGLDRFRGAAKVNLNIITHLPIDARVLHSIESLNAEVQGCDVLVDAILGTGLTRDVQGLHREVIELLNESGKPILSIDIPSGLQGDTGKVMGAAVGASCTVTFGLPKLGSLLFPGFEFCGRLYVSHISFPPSVYDRTSLKIEVNMPRVWSPPDWSDRPKALFVGGSPNSCEAAYLAAVSFLNLSDGKALLAVPESVAASITGQESDLVVVPQKVTDSGCIALCNRSGLLQLAGTMDTVIVHLGSHSEKETQQLEQELMQNTEAPLVIWGDRVTAASGSIQSIQEREASTVLIATLSQMSGLTGESLSDLENNRIGVLQSTAKELHAVIVLEEGHSLIACPDERVYVNLSGSTSLTTARSSDVLAGAIAAMYEPHIPVEETVRRGVFVRGFAADLVGKDNDTDRVSALRILDLLPPAVSMGWDDLEESFKHRYTGAVTVL